MSRPSVEHVFVYGTLREGFSNRGRRILAEHAELVGQARVPGRLYDVGSFPALVLSGPCDDEVVGEVYRLTDAPERGLELLDRYEGARGPDPGPYRRQAVTTVLEDGSEIDAWAYVWTRPPERLEPIESGDYLAYVEGSNTPR